jgi:hypothetical protein
MQNIKNLDQEHLDCCESNHHKQWLGKGCSKLVDGKKQAKRQWLQGPSEVNENKLINVRREAIKHFREKKRECL